MNVWYEQEELKEKNEKYRKVIKKLLNAIDFTLKKNHDLLKELNKEIDMEIYDHNDKWVVMNLENVMEINSKSKKLAKLKGK